MGALLGLEVVPVDVNTSMYDMCAFLGHGVVPVAVNSVIRLLHAYVVDRVWKRVHCITRS